MRVRVRVRARVRVGVRGRVGVRARVRVRVRVRARRPRGRRDAWKGGSMRVWMPCTYVHDVHRTARLSRPVSAP